VGFSLTGTLKACTTKLCIILVYVFHTKCSSISLPLYYYPFHPSFSSFPPLLLYVVISVYSSPSSSSSSSSSSFFLLFFSFLFSSSYSFSLSSFLSYSPFPLCSFLYPNFLSFSLLRTPHFLFFSFSYSSFPPHLPSSFSALPLSIVPSDFESRHFVMMILSRGKLRLSDAFCVYNLLQFINGAPLVTDFAVRKCAWI
jgi:hypothetical protein